MNQKYGFMLLILLLLTAVTSAQTYRVFGKVTEASTGEALVGANVYVKGSNVGAATTPDGSYELSLKSGTYKIVCSYIGFKKEEVLLEVTNNTELNFSLEDYQFSLNITVLADRAKERETPVAFTDIDSEEMEKSLGSRDIPLVLNTTPSVYATQQGGGAGDARMNIRGFNQNNIAIMINGVPVNDMENGWVYWSNWDGVGDATSSIQVQRGMSAVNLATPSIGGTMNIITDPAMMKAGATFKQELGNDGFLKSTLFAHSGLINDKWAVSAGGVRKISDGIVDRTWTDAWAYYFGASLNINKDHRLEFYALGAPQRHGQNLFKQNIATYDAEYARDLDSYDEAAIYDPATGEGKFIEQGRDFNQNWAPVTTNYNGEQYYWGGKTDRHEEGFINTRENYYHKPQINLNWYANFTKKLSLYTILYYSGGQGGGSGDYGDIYRNDAFGTVGGENYRFYFGPSPWTWNLDATIAANRGTAGSYYVDGSEIVKEDGQSIGILRNSINNQWTIGAISKAYYKASENLNLSVGIDWRTAQIEHFREVRDLLGGEYFIDNSSDFWVTESQRIKHLGDKIDYNFTNDVDWIGGYAQAEYTAGKFTVYGTAGYSGIKYYHTNHFMDDGTGNEYEIESDFISGYQFKGGASFRLTPTVNLYGNAGYVSKVPIFDNVIDDQTGLKNDDYTNEKFVSLEAGVNFVPVSRRGYARLNGYFTTWQDRTYKQEEYEVTEDQEVNIFLFGVDSRHLGLELEAGYQPLSLVSFDGAVSFGNWIYTDDVDGESRVPGTTQKTEYTFYIKDLKVGDAPQTQFALSATLYPLKGMSFQLVGKYYTNYYSDFNPFSRLDPADRAQPWEVPSYAKFDAHFSYDLPVDLSGVDIQLFAHVFNLFDTKYIQDATDNSQYNAFDKDHDADDAEVFFGLPRFFNIGVQLAY